MILLSIMKTKRDSQSKLLDVIDKLQKVIKAEGFLGVEVVQVQTSADADYEEYVYMMKWENRKSYLAWRQSEEVKLSRQHDHAHDDFILEQKVSMGETLYSIGFGKPETDRLDELKHN